MSTERTNAAHLLAMADLLDGRDIGELYKEMRYNLERFNLPEAEGILMAIVKAKQGVPVDVDAVDRLVRETMDGPRLGPFIKQRPDHLRTVFFTLRIETPWAKNAVELPLRVTYPDVLRAFRPLPREHDLDSRFDARNNTLEQVRQQNSARENAEQAIGQELKSMLRKWMQSQDPVKGVYPDNVIE